MDSGHPGARPRRAASRAGTARWRPSTAQAPRRGPRPHAGRGLPRRRSWRRCAGSLVLGRPTRTRSPTSTSCACPRADGRSLMVNVSVAPFQLGSGERCGTILILDDVTARVRLEEQLQHSEKMASIGLLAAGVAHEVNTPLTGISSYTQMLREQVAAEDPRAPLLEKIEKQTFRAAKIINNLLNFSRSGSGGAGAPRRQQGGARRALPAGAPARRRAHQGAQGAGGGPARGARQREPPAAGVLQPDPERPRRHAQRRLADAGHARRRRRGGRGGEATPATASSARTSSASTTRSSPPRASAAAPASASRSPTASCRSTAARSSWTARPARAPPSRSTLPPLPPREAAALAMRPRANRSSSSTTRR